MHEPLDIDPDIRRARTLPSSVYHEPGWYRRMCERVFARTWHLYPAHLPELEPGSVRPWNFLAGSLDEPLLLTRDAHDLHLRSNVCTHRGAIVVERPGHMSSLRCPYHGRRFTLDGRFVSMPHFEDALDFPRPCDDLAAVPMARWGHALFASLAPAHPIDELLDPLRSRLSYLPWDRLAPAPGRDYHVNASWALYCDNYLEGLHIPFVHPALGRALDLHADETHLLPRGVLQLGLTSSPDQPRFRPPAGHVDHGRPVAAYYYWLFPCTMINVYPWGLSINVVLPLGAERTRVVYLTSVWDESQLERGVGSQLDQVEHEDERIVESVARGVRARLYERGRYSPSRERGVHHFHRLLAQLLTEDP